MDEQRLSELFRDAVAEPPPASFGHEEVVAASHRITARRRNLAGGATLLGVAVLAGALVIGDRTLPNNDDTAGDAAVASSDRQETAAAPPQTPEGPMLQAPDSALCGPIDTELAADLNAVLATHGLVASGPAREASEECLRGSRGAAVPVAGGVLSALLHDNPQRSVPDRRHSETLILSDGRSLTVISTPDRPGQPAPLADQLPRLVKELADAL